MNTPMGARRRWDWLNGFCTAFLHVVLNDIQLPIDSSLTFSNACNKFVQNLVERYKDRDCLEPPRVYVPSQEELHYLFHLEAELWGPDCKMYSTFFPNPGSDTLIWQTFHFTLGFFLIERWLYLFMPGEKQKKGRGLRRRHLFGVEDGVFSVHHKDAFACLGLPFALVGSTQGVKGIDQKNDEAWYKVSKESTPEELKLFYKATTGKESCCEIVEASFVSTRKNWLPKRLLKKKHERLPKGTCAWWYDVLWKYSESVRYNPISVRHVEEKSAFYWNRSIRWVIALTTTGLIWLATLEASQKTKGEIVKAWKEAKEKNPILKRVYSDCEKVLPE